MLSVSTSFFVRVVCSRVLRVCCCEFAERKLTLVIFRSTLQVAKKLQKKQKNVIDEGVKKLKEKREAEQGRERIQEEDRKREAQARQAPAALGRFFKK